MSAVSSAEIYRVIDKEGNVTYTDQAPTANSENNSAEVVETEAQTNVVDSAKAIEEKHPEWLKAAKVKRAEESEQQRRELAKAQAQQRKIWKKDLKAAKLAVKDAALALDVGKEVGDGDFVGMASGGARPSSEYLQCITQLEQELQDAKRHLKKLKRNKP